jgi:beta-glucosidase/6-phospho-beta-glucosidase/beta-galactosidase
LNSFSKEDAEFIAEIGYNTIRLGVLWAGFEPE